MTIKEKANLIWAIISHMKFHSKRFQKEIAFYEKSERKPFCEGDAFFSLAFKSDSELKQIAKLIGV